ncbi:MAG: HEAT repeat domain-containing protein [Euryarchaeota archaeon]|nr:HEAT repeat domain-containing protein [Euryarchaeota archaeon]
MAAGGLDSEIARLRHRDVRKRRRAIRVLFDTDIPRALEGFVPLLNDKDPWFRSKSLEAHRKWAPKQGVATLKVLAEHSWLEARRCAANLLGEFSEDTTDIALLLIEDEDLTCQRKAAEALLKGRDAELHIERFLNHEDSGLRRLAILCSAATVEHRTSALSDTNNSVREAALHSIVENGETLTEESMSDALRRGIKVNPLLSSAVKNAGEVLVQVTKDLSGSIMNDVVKELRLQCSSLEDKSIQILLKNQRYAVLGRWLQGKKSEEFDALRWTIIRNQSVSSIERARLLERLIGRCGEPEIARENRIFLEECEDDLLRVTAENLSTASTELGL